MPASPVTTIGIVSDTHGTLHPRVLDVLRDAGVERILHAGDVGDYSVLSAMAAVAPVVAVRGNVDRSGPVADLPLEVRLDIGGAAGEGVNPGASQGREPMSLVESAGGVLFVNPGAAGASRRFGRPQTLAILRVTDGQAEADIIEL